MLVALVALVLHPALPGGASRWLLFAIAVPLLYVGAELLAEKLLSRESGVRLTAERFSWKRVLVALLGLLAIALLLATTLFL